MKRAKDIAYIAVCTAIIIICSWITIPLPAMQFTLQVFGVAFAAYFLGIKRSWIAVLAFLLLGSVGVPVFSNFNAGFGALIGPTGGFLIGFIPFAIIISLFTHLGKGKIVYELIGGLLGHIVLYIAGVLQYVIISVNANGTDFFTVLGAFLLAMLPLYAIDIVKIVAACFLARLLKRTLK